jgi:hypothetical protein
MVCIHIQKTKTMKATPHQWSGHLMLDLFYKKLMFKITFVHCTHNVFTAYTLRNVFTAYYHVHVPYNSTTFDY